MLKKNVYRNILKVLHWFIILNFIVEIVYCSAIVFFVLRPSSGQSGPLFLAAQSVPFELLVKRRLYAIEVWIATSGLAIYLAITEFYPRMTKK